MANQENKSSLIRYLDRREKEDGLLNTRTRLVLITNSIAAVAVGTTDNVITKIIITLSMICIDVLWIKCSFEAARFIRLLTIEIKKEDPSLPDEKLWRDKIYSKRFISWGPTTIIGKAIPVTLLLAWSIGLAISIFVKYFDITLKSP